MPKKNLLLVLFIILQLAGQTQSDLDLVCIGESSKIQSSVLNEERILNIYKPQTFDEKIPCDVFYLLDGSKDEDFIHIAGLSQFFNMMFKMPNYIIVGIANVDRKRDFTFPTSVIKDKEDFPTTGNSSKFIEFIKNDLQPYVNNNYFTSGNTYLIGQSLGGLLASEIFTEHSSLFNRYVIVSPSLWWDNQSLLRKAEVLFKTTSPTVPYVFIAVGSNEHRIMKKSSRRFYKLIAKNKRCQKVLYKRINNEDHATVLHQAVYDAFKSLFEPRY